MHTIISFQKGFSPIIFLKKGQALKHAYENQHVILGPCIYLFLSNQVYIF